MDSFINYSINNKLPWRNNSRPGSPEYGIHPHKGIHIFFNNGYGVSIITGYGSYGGEQGLFEIAILLGDITTSKLNYDTEITDDVIGYLTESDVFEYINKIKALKRKFYNILGVKIVLK